MDKQELFLTLAGSICTHAEETLGTDLFLKITLEKARVNPTVIYPSTVIFLNSNGKMKISPKFPFQVAELINDDWIDRFIGGFKSFQLNCERVIGVLDSSRNLNWYIDFVTNIFGNHALEKDGGRIML